MFIYGLDYLNNFHNSLNFGFDESSNVLLSDYSTDILSRTNIKRAVFCKNINEVLLCNAALVDYIIPTSNILKKSVELAEKYLFDSKILSLLENTQNLELAAETGVDCVLIFKYDIKFKEFFIK